MGERTCCTNPKSNTQPQWATNTIRPKRAAPAATTQSQDHLPDRSLSIFLLSFLESRPSSSSPLTFIIMVSISTRVLQTFVAFLLLNSPLVQANVGNSLRGGSRGKSYAELPEGMEEAALDKTGLVIAPKTLERVE
uniref:Uncharacterized protein n=1 Tax=Entomoneis paludosa TaxID=265537 RepID=A0A7S2YF48_9STRA